MRLIVRVLCLSFVLLSTATSLDLTAQKPARYYEPKALFEQAMEFYEKEKYAAAQQDFDRLALIAEDEHSELAVNSEYYASLCALRLFHKDSEVRLSNFVKDHPESAWARTAYFELGNYSYRRKKYKKAIQWYDKVRLRDLNDDEIVDLYYKRGYSYFKRGNKAEARDAFSNLTETNNKYYAPANYYFAHMAYEDGKYEAALAGFKRLEGDENFASVIPYYISQILFVQKKYDEVVEYGPGALESSSAKKQNEIARIVGESYYNLNKYAEAIPYLETYQKSGAQKSRQDNYQMGFAYYRNGQHEEAIRSFNLMTNQEDELTQTATYHMGDSYLKLDQKSYARNAFKRASKFDFDRTLQEDALFNYAKLAYELSVNPFHEAIRAFEQYLKDYPTSDRRDQAYEFLLDVYLTTKNYQAALDALDKIEQKNPRVKSAYQLSAYNRATELFLNRKFDQADAYYDLVNRYPMDPALIAAAEYWKAEILYQNKEYDQAIMAYKDFQAKPTSFSSPLYKESNYSIGYAYFRQKEYRNAETGFNLYLNSPGQLSKKKQNDAYLRLGDCSFVAKDYGKSIGHYDKAIALDVIDTDYALFQKARCLGFQDNYPGEVATLQKLIADNKKSSMLVGAKYQLGQTFFRMNRIDEALTELDGLIGQHPKSPYVKKSLLTKGLIHYRKKEYEAAIASFKKVVEDYPSDQDSEAAQMRIQDVYVELGRIDEFNDWYEENVPTGSVAAQDSVNYRAAENVYTSGNCEQAIPAFVDYIKKFQPGIFGLNANYYLAECHLKNGQSEEALEHYLFVVGMPNNAFTEPALLAAATLSYEAGNMNDALQHYTHLEQVASFENNILEARIGQMRIHFNKGEYSEAISFADAVIADEKTPEHILREAHMARAKILLSNGEIDNAREEFFEVTQQSSGKLGAEAKFNIARIHYDKGEYDISEQEVFGLIREYPSQEYWKVEAFMLLSDVYVGKEDLFQAKATLQSIIDNVDDEEVMQRAIAKYQAIVKLEEGESEGSEEEMEIDMNFQEIPEEEIEDNQLLFDD